MARRGCQGPCCPGCGLPRGYGEEHHPLCRRWHGDFQRLCCTYLCRAKSRRPWGRSPARFERFPAVALSKTYNTNQQTADSAGTMTAMITGVKTLAGVLSVDGSVRRGDCASGQGAEVPSLIEEAEAAGLPRVSFLRPALPTLPPAPPTPTWWSGTGRASRRQRRRGDARYRQPTAQFQPRRWDRRGSRQRTGHVPTKYRRRPGISRKVWRAQGWAEPNQGLAGGSPDGAYLWNGEALAAAADVPSPVLGLFEPSHMQFEADRAQDPEKVRPSRK